MHRRQRPSAPDGRQSPTGVPTRGREHVETSDFYLRRAAGSPDKISSRRSRAIVFTKRAEDCAQPQSPGSFASGSYINVFRLAVVFQVYMPFEGRPIHLTTDQRNDLEEIARSRALAAGFVQRAKIVLLLADGVSARAVATKLEVSRPTIAKWRRRFLEGSVDGLTSHYTGRAPWKLTARVRARVLAATRRPPPDGTTHWSCRRLAAHLGVGKDVVQRVWREADLRPHRLARYMASNDPDFETKAADVIGLYLDPPRHAAVFCVDEKTAIQALDRRDRVLPLSPGRIERHGFEYKRHGTLSLYAALNIQTGEVQGKTTARHTSQDFVGFLGEVVTTCEPAQEIHVILDNLSAHKTQTHSPPLLCQRRGQLRPTLACPA